MSNKQFVGLLVCVAIAFYSLGAMHGASSERNWPTPPPADPEIELCKLELP